METACQECPNRAKRNKTKAVLKNGSNILICGGALTSPMAAQGRKMSREAIDLLSDNMKAVDLHDEDFSYTSFVRCAYDPDLYDTKENKTIKKQCRSHLKAVIARDKPKVIVPLGAEAASSVMGHAVKITKARGVPIWSDEFNCWVLPTINPHMVHMNPQHEPIFASDCKSLRRLIDSGYDPEEAGRAMLGDYSMVTDLQFLIDEDPAELAFDVETLGLNFAAPDTDLLTIQLCPEPGRGYLIPWNHPESPIGRRQQHKLRKQLKILLTSPDRLYYGQNLKFDVLWLWEALGFRARIDHDAKMLAALLDENLQNKDLDTLTKLYCPSLAGYADAFNSKYDKSRMDLVPLAEIINYGIGDTDASLRVCHYLLDELEKDPKLLNHYNRVSIPGLNTFAAIERRGQDIDTHALDEFEEVLAAEVDRQYNSLIAQVPDSIQRDHAEKGLKFTRAAFLLDILFYHEDGFKLKPTVFTAKTEKLAADKRIPSVSSKTHLPFFFDECPFTIELAEHIKTARILGTNVRRFRENYIIGDKVFPTYSLDRTVTGRSSAINPNSQNYIKHGPVAKAYRKIFVPPPQRIQIEADYSQAELRIAADIANEKTMLDIYNNDGDIHITTAATIKQIAVEEFLRMPKEEITEARRQAKACIAEGQLVLTNEGLVPIENVMERHLVWDGVEWVSHEGVVFKGYKEVETHGPLTATEDHEVYEEETNTTLPFREFTSEVGRPRFVISGNGELPVRVNIDTIEENTEYTWTQIRCVFLHCLQKGDEYFNRQYTEGCDYGLSVPERAICTEIWWGEGGEYSGGQIRCHETEVQDKRYTCAEKLFNAGNRKQVQKQGTLYNVDDGESATRNVQRGSYRQDRQRWTLRAWELAAGVWSTQQHEQEEQCENTLSWSECLYPSYMAFVSVFWRGFQFCPMLHSKAGKKVSVRRRVASIQKTEFQSGEEEVRSEHGCSEHLPKRYERVYDIVNAGPRHRYTVSGVLVHNCNFGYLYSMWWKTFVSYAKTSYGVDFTLKEAERIRNDFFDLYPGLVIWHDDTKAFASEHGYVRSYTGRIRHLPMVWSDDQGVQSEALRQAINSSVQETASSLGVMAMSRLEQNINPFYLPISGFVHDALYASVEPRYLLWGAKTLKHYMETNPIKKWFGIDMKVKIVADVGFGMNGGEVHEMESLTLKKSYDFTQHDLPFDLPKQETPPNHGRYTPEPHLINYNIRD